MSRPRESNELMNNSISRGLDVLVQLATSSGVRSIASISEETGIPPATVFRILNTLVKKGFAIKTRRGEYSIGGTLFSLVSQAGHSMGGLFQGVLRELVNVTHESASVALLSDSEAVYIAHQASSLSLRQHAKVGSSTHLHSSGVGKVLLQQLDAETLDKVLEGLSYPRFTEHTLCSSEELRAELVSVAKDGYATDLQEQELGVCCMAVPIPDNSLFALSVSGPVGRMTLDFRHDVALPALLRAAQQIADILSPQ